MMVHPEIEKFIARARIETLRLSAQRPLRAAPPARNDERGIELRLCRVGDHDALVDLAALSERRLAQGSFVLGFVDGKLAAALPVDGGPLLADPFLPTSQLRHLLELRAAQIKEPRGHATLRRLVRRSAVV